MLWQNGWKERAYTIERFTQGGYMKRLVLLVILFMVNLITACNGNVKEKTKEPAEKQTKTVFDGDSEKESVTENSLYTISEENRDKSKYQVKDGKMIFPMGKVTGVKGHTCGRAESDLAISEKEIEDLITALEKHAVASEVTETLPLPPTNNLNWEEGYGQIGIIFETASGEEKPLILYFGKSDLVQGSIYGSNQNTEIMFWIDITEFAEKLRDMVGYKTIDLAELDRAVSAECTSLINGKTLTLKEEQLRQLIKGIQGAKKELATNMPQTVSVLISLDDGEVVHTVFTGTGYSIIGIEAQLYRFTEETAQPFLDLFIENDMPLYKNPEWNSKQVPIIGESIRNVDVNNYINGVEKDGDFFLTYAGAASYDSIIRLGGKQRDDTVILFEDSKINLPEGMVINITRNKGEKKVLAMESKEKINHFIELLESSSVTKRKTRAINSSELNLVTLNTAGEYILFLFSLGGEEEVNCRILSENAQNHEIDLSLKSNALLDLLVDILDN